jgi:hypothetical protein
LQLNSHCFQAPSLEDFLIIHIWKSAIVLLTKIHINQSSVKIHSSLHGVMECEIYLTRESLLIFVGLYN